MVVGMQRLAWRHQGEVARHVGLAEVAAELLHPVPPQPGGQQRVEQLRQRNVPRPDAAAQPVRGVVRRVELPAPCGSRRAGRPAPPGTPRSVRRSSGGRRGTPGGRRATAPARLGRTPARRRPRWCARRRARPRRPRRPAPGAGSRPRAPGVAGPAVWHLELPGGQLQVHHPAAGPLDHGRRRRPGPGTSPGRGRATRVSQEALPSGPEPAQRLETSSYHSAIAS
jgi:hypothetical protein